MYKRIHMYRSYIHTQMISVRTDRLRGRGQSYHSQPLESQPERPAGVLVEAAVLQDPLPHHPTPEYLEPLPVKENFKLQGRVREGKVGFDPAHLQANNSEGHALTTMRHVAEPRLQARARAQETKRRACQLVSHMLHTCLRAKRSHDTM
jgi:hypothetical protein